MTVGILDVNNVEGTRMPFSMHNSSNTTCITTSSDHAQVSGLELDRVHDFVGVDVQPDGVVGLDDGIGVTDGPAVRGVQVGHVLGAHLDGLDTAELVFSLLIGDPMNGITTLDVINQTEVFASFLNLHNVHETGRKPGISPDLAVDLDQPLLHDGLDLFVSQGVFQSILQENGDGHGLAKSVRSRTWPTRVDTSKLVQHP